AVGVRAAVVAGDPHLLADQARLDARAHASDRRAGPDDAVLQLGVVDGDVTAYGRERPDVGAVDLRARGDEGRTEDRGVAHLGAGLHHDLADQLAVLDNPVDPPAQLRQDQAVGVEDVLRLAGVLPPALAEHRRDRLAGVDQPLAG